jgi:tRNA (guanine37-N1)-methyltransferase
VTDAEDGERTDAAADPDRVERPCVAVAREDGERARTALAERGALDGDFDIDVADGRVYVPVTESAVDLDLPVDVDHERVRRPVERREGQTTPADLLEFEPTYERLGDLALLDEAGERAERAAEAVVASDVPVERVLNRASEVRGRERVRDWEQLAGEGSETVHREYGHEFLLDPREVFFSPRLATERDRVADQADAGEHAVDMFAGVGPYTVPMAARGADVVAVDVNPDAVAYLRENLRRNDAADRVTVRQGDVREVADEFAGWADRLVMNLPHSADAFLDAAVTMAGDDAAVHYYDIQPDDEPFAAGERALREAAGDSYDVSVETRRVVRSYAPHEVNVVLDARLRRR